MSFTLSASELEDIRSSYEEELAGLTFNSKPIINMLTTIAQENMNAASVICKTIENRIQVAPPHQKLPVMYLLDSISKNVGSPFTTIFGRNLYRIYMDCYTAVDTNTRRSLEALFNTWKLPVPGSNSAIPVYPLEDTRRIDEALLRIRAIHDRHLLYQQPHLQMPPRNFSPNPVYGGYSQPQSFVDLTQETHRQASPMNYHPPPTIHPGLVPGSRDLTADNIALDIASLLQTLESRIRVDPLDVTSGNFITSLRGLRQLLLTQSLQPLQLADIRNSLREVTAYCAQPLHTNSRSVSPIMDTRYPANNSSDLFAQLAKAGIIPQSNGAASQPIIASHTPESTIYIPLASSAMLQSRPELIDILYSKMPLQCYQCGQRWHDSASDSIAKDEHLDWHFKTNKRMREHSVRAQSRALYLSEQEWVHFSISQASDGEHTEGVIKAGPDPSLSTVPKPTDPALHDSVCPICKEPFLTDWDDVSEEWVWKNAVNVEGIVYHAMCHAEALAAQRRTNVSTARTKRYEQQENSSSSMVKGETLDEDDEDIALPVASEVSVKRESPQPDAQIRPDMTAAKDPSEQAPVSLEDALRSLSGTLNALHGLKRKASDEGEQDNERRVKSESMDQ